MTFPLKPSSDPSHALTPIPPPNHPRQYRAIGLVKGIFQRMKGEKSHGKLITPDGTEIYGVFLGKMFSLLKNHLDLTQSHLWVVYPRTLQKDDELYIQIAGIWEPETLKPEQRVVSSPSPPDGFFSIRGEVVYASVAKELVIIKIRQSPKKKDKKAKFFKLKLRGTLPHKPVGHFWDLIVQREEHQLWIKSAEDLGIVLKKQPFTKNRSTKPSLAPKLPIKGIHKPLKPSASQFSLPKPTIRKSTDT